uniref:Hypothetical orf1 n=1 Tax=Epidermophyton floccosum TaxID=34391 RepID=Q3ZEH6_EPIFL|nr:hypothetical orf1 [Epidermophyton floccosum]AAW78227.1 hypothetical orf1 [Epidermophyton floccosum]
MFNPFNFWNCINFSNLFKNKKTPVISYPNVNLFKDNIIKDNKGKTGIYMLTNLITNEFYVGSAINLSEKFNEYFYTNYLKKKELEKFCIIYDILLKYDNSKFKLDILEYCELIELIKKEEYYINNLNPTYNILKLRGLNYEFKFSEAEKEILKDKSKNIEKNFLNI